MQVIQSTSNPDEFWSNADGWTDRDGADEFSADEATILGLPDGGLWAPRSTGWTYKVIRFFQDPREADQIIKTGLTLDEAQEHCGGPEGSSTTCTLPQNVSRTELFGPWFDGYTKEN